MGSAIAIPIYLRKQLWSSKQSQQCNKSHVLIDLKTIFDLSHEEKKHDNEETILWIYSKAIYVQASYWKTLQVALYCKLYRVEIINM